MIQCRLAELLAKLNGAAFPMTGDLPGRIDFPDKKSAGRLRGDKVGRESVGID
jgi:hypothetical protein